MPNDKILVVEDDQTLLSALKYSITKEGYSFLSAGSGLQAIDLYRKEKPDLIILDVMLPELDGLEVCRVLRRETIVPILMLTALTEEIDVVLGLEVGADDYMTKPFSIRELMARVRAMLRRAKMDQEPLIIDPASEIIFHSGDLNMNCSRHTVSLGGKGVVLHPKEFDLLAFLMKNKGQVFSREILLDKVWGYDFFGDSRTVDVHMRWLREKIEIDPDQPVRLITVRGVGYKFEE